MEIRAANSRRITKATRKLRPWETCLPSAQDGGTTDPRAGLGEWLTYRSCWRLLAESVVDGMARQVKEKLGIDPASYEPYWSNWEADWLDLAHRGDQPRRQIDDPDSWLW